MAIASKASKASSPNVKIQDVPDNLTIGNINISTRDDNAIDVTVTPATTGGIPAQYRVVSSPGSVETVSNSSVITVPSLTGGTAYSFQVRAESAGGAVTPYTAPSQSITPEFNAMVAIASTPLTNAVVFSFGNIPQNYQDLFIVVNGVMNATSALAIDDINNAPSGGMTLSRTALIGNGSSAISERSSNVANALEFSSPSSTLVAGVNTLLVHIPNYTNSTTFKTVLGRRASDNNGSGTTSIVVGTIQTTSPLTFFKFSSQDPAKFFTSGFATLYGIRASI